MQAIYNRQPDGWITNDAKSRLAKLTLIQRIKYFIYIRLQASVFVTTWLFPTNPFYEVDTSDLDPLIEAMQESYYADLLEAQTYTKRAGAVFFHFLQPHMFTIPPDSPYTRNMMANNNVVPPKINVLFEQGYPALRLANQQAAGQGVLAYDISTVLDQARQAGQAFYLDYMHIDDEGNAIVAQKIAEIFNQWRFF
jgi:hypothetical protein